MSESLQIVRDVCGSIKNAFQAAAFWMKDPRDHRHETKLMDYIHRAADHPKFVQKALDEIEKGRTKFGQVNIHGQDEVALAVMHKQPEILRALLIAGAPFDHIRSAGCQEQTALDTALNRIADNFVDSEVHREMAEILIDVGAPRAKPWSSDIVSARIKGEDIVMPEALEAEITWDRITDPFSIEDARAAVKTQEAPGEQDAENTQGVTRTPIPA